MKKLSVKLLAMLLVLIQGIVSVSCSNDEPEIKETPKVSFERPTYILATGEITVKVTADVAPENNINIPVTVASQNAKEGTDYTMPVKTVTIKGGETSGTFTIKRIDDSIGEENLELTVNLGQGDGYDLGLRNFVTVTLLSENGYIVSFADAAASIKCDQDFEITVDPMKGWAGIPADETFEIEIVPESTTATEGVHFTVDKTVTVKAKKEYALFNIKLLKVEAEKNVVTLRLTEKPGFAFGSNPTLTITLSDLDNLTGTWAFKEWVNSEMVAMWGSDMSMAPTMTSSDKLTFNGTATECTFSPSLTGGLKNYFGNESRTIKYSGLEQYAYQSGMSEAKEILQVYLVPDVNIKFSPKETKKGEAKVGFRIITVGNEEILECIIDAFEPVADELWGEWFEWMPGDDPTHIASWFPYVLYFSRVN